MASRSSYINVLHEWAGNPQKVLHRYLNGRTVEMKNVWKNHEHEKWAEKLPELLRSMKWLMKC
jgi:hypothetical protein